MTDQQKSLSRKFHTTNVFETRGVNYHLLPFSFISLANGNELLVNFVGDFVIVPNGTTDDIIQRKIDTESELYVELIANYIISSKRLPELSDVLATRYRTKKAHLEEFTALHIFVVTLRCNHTCHYCQVSRVSESRSDFDMTFANLDSAIRKMFCSPSQHLTMEFQGGEPLLAFDKIVYAVNQAIHLNNEFKKQISFVICTNTTVINEEILKFCKANNILISTSLDGPEILHNANRVKKGDNSYELVLEGIAQFRRALGYDRVAALMTTTTLSLRYPREIIDTYISNGFKSIFLRPISPYGFALKNQQKNKYNTEKFIEFYKKGLDYIIELNIKGIDFSEDYATILLKKMLTPFSVGYVDLQSPAGLVNSVIVYNYDGDVYASDEGRMLAEQGDHTFRLGKVTDNYLDLVKGETSMLISETWANECLAGCADCALNIYCGADPVYHYATQGDMYGHRPSSQFCQRNMAIIKYLFLLIDQRGDKILPIFYRWIHNAAR